MGHWKSQKFRQVAPAMTCALVILALLGMTFGGVAAYLSVSAGFVENKLETDTAVQPTITEIMENNLKKDVKVNVGNPGYAVYVRAAVVATWRDGDGNVLAKTPADSEYTIEYSDDDWFEYGGFWYCKTMVNSGDTPVLIKSCTPIAEKSDYHLHVEIISQTIQALGTTDTNDTPAVTAAWGIPLCMEGEHKGELDQPST